ncbi:uncharacterized protein LOC122332958 [Puntigrus tetrazona]|uniref:uncharacterized protein LOC122332958 n=1 Tax=Puntigrus tetrazona TaxID=1606681 RepID=UPI001C89C905|nr:uncharacterized protein LOC122332958 [Puntigrus tetrazona]
MFHESRLIDPEDLRRELTHYDPEELRATVGSETENQESRRHEHESNPEIIYSTQVLKRPFEADLTVKSDVFRSAQREKLYKPETWEIQKDIVKKPSMELASAKFSTCHITNTINVIDNIDRPAEAFTKAVYAQSEAYADKPKTHRKEDPQSWKARGPNARASAEANIISAAAMARAEIASASAQAGPVGVKVGLGVDTGASLSLIDGLELKVLGTGFTFGPRTSVSFLGSELSCSVM